jgi:hypothetical protein
VFKLCPGIVVLTCVCYGMKGMGEHGVGIGKKKYLVEELGQGTVNLMKTIKRDVDPLGLFNPRWAGPLEATAETTYQTLTCPPDSPNPPDSLFTLMTACAPLYVSACHPQPLSLFRMPLYFTPTHTVFCMPPLFLSFMCTPHSLSL